VATCAAGANRHTCVVDLRGATVVPGLR
jgi:predicted amidohydrolase YtcJ